MFGIVGGMRKNLISRFHRLAWVSYVLAMIVSSLIPVDFSQAPEYSDKIMHAAAYCLLVLFWPPSRLRSAGVMLGFAAGLGLVLEIAQGILPTGRFMDPWDALANALGACLGLGLMLAARRGSGGRS